MVYFGPTFDLELHFSQLGYDCPGGSNVADFAMDVLAGLLPWYSSVYYQSWQLHSASAAHSLYASQAAFGYHIFVHFRVCRGSK